MAKRGFDLAALARQNLGDAAAARSELDAMRYIPAPLISANAANFYEMSDLEELAASIELTGLLHPIIVRPDGDGAYRLIDGERRFRAMTEVLGRTEVPAIVRVPVNDVIEELMLIEANRTQRKMTAADLSKQAERYTELLAQLRDAGVEIPGRLRDRVAEAMQVSSTKLARLHAIRQNLEPGLLSMFDDGDLSESVAYELSRYDHQKQLRIAYCEETGCPDTPRELTADLVRRIAEADKYSPAEAPDSGASGSVWDPEAYLAERQAEDDDFFFCLNSVADRFLKDLGCVNYRHEGIEKLKDQFGRPHCSWWHGAASVDCSPKGVTLCWDDNGIPEISRTWTDVYDMLCTIALSRAAARPVSNSDTAPSGPEWHRIDFDHKPLFDFKRTVLLWGPDGLRNVPQHLIYDTIKHAPETVTHWAIIDGPETEVITKSSKDEREEK